MWLVAKQHHFEQLPCGTINTSYRLKILLITTYVVHNMMHSNYNMGTVLDAYAEFRTLLSTAYSFGKVEKISLVSS